MIRKAHLFTFLVCLICLSMRYVDLLRHPSLWAEDGVYFFADAFCHPSMNFLKPAIATLFVAQRFVSQIIVWLVPGYAAPIFSCLALIVCTAILTYIADPKFIWLIPNVFLRVFLGVLFAVGAGSIEVQNNLVGVAYVITWALVLSLLQRPLPSSGVFFLLWFLIPLSTPLALSVVPLALVTYFITRRKMLLFGSFWCVVTAFANFVMGQKSKIAEVVPQPIDNIDVVFTILDRTVYEHITNLWFGFSHAVALLAYSTQLCFLLTIFCLSVLGWLFHRGRADSQKRLAIIGVLSVSVFYVGLHVIARPTQAVSPFLNGTIGIGPRHLMLPTFTMLTVTAIFISEVPLMFQRLVSRLSVRMFLLLPAINYLMYSAQMVPVCQRSRTDEWWAFKQRYEQLQTESRREPARQLIAELPIAPQLLEGNACVSWATLKIYSSDSNYECEIIGGHR